MLDLLAVRGKGGLATEGTTVTSGGDEGHLSSVGEGERLDGAGTGVGGEDEVDATILAGNHVLGDVDVDLALGGTGAVANVDDDELDEVVLALDGDTTASVDLVETDEKEKKKGKEGGKVSLRWVEEEGERRRTCSDHMVWVMLSDWERT